MCVCPMFDDVFLVHHIDGIASYREHTHTTFTGDRNKLRRTIQSAVKRAIQVGNETVT